MNDMESRRSPISALSNELLLSIFESGLSSSTLFRCMLCCRRWSSLSSSVLYRHLVLTVDTLSSFVRCSSESRDSLVETLTLRVKPARSAETEDAIRQLRSDLRELAPRVGNMVNLRSFSLFAPSKLPSSRWVPDALIATVLGSLPPSCVGLELSARYLSHPGSVEDDEGVHLCNSIRKMIPRLRFLRLNLSKLCPSAFGVGFDPARQPDEPSFEPVKAPHLEQCLVKIAEPKYTSGHDRSWICGCPEADIVAVLAKYLLIFKAASDAVKLEKLWIVDTSPMTDPYTTFHAFVRRDVLAEKSLLIPYKNVGLHKFNKEGIFVRMPEDEGGQDLLSTIDGVMSLAEQRAWVETAGGARMPAAEISTKRRRALIEPVIRTADEWFAKTNISCILWADEKKTGMRLLDVTEEGLDGNSTAVIRTPGGWTRHAGGFLQKSV